MAEKAFSQIKETEAEAQAIIVDAQDEANRIVKRAEEETAGAFIKFSDACKEQASDEVRKAEANAREDSIAFSKETAEMCAALEQELSAQKSLAIDKAIDVIMSRK